MNICLFSGQGDNKKIIFNEYSNKYFKIIEKQLKINKKDILEKKYIFKNQILMLVNNVASFDKLKVENNIFFNNINTMVGYSLGEYSSLVCSGSLNFEDCLNLIKFRSEIMYEVGKKTNSTLITIIGINEFYLKILLKGIKYYISIYLSKKSFVLAVSKNDLNDIIKKIKNIKKFNKIGIKILNVDGGFHSPYMNDCVDEFKKFIDKINFNIPKYDVIGNVGGERYIDEKDIRDKLILHLISPFNWENILLNLDIKELYEVGSNNLEKTLLLNNINNYNYFK